jgi:hypothetical protein
MLPLAPFNQPAQITALQPWRRIPVMTTSFADANGRYAWVEICHVLQPDRPRT